MCASDRSILLVKNKDISSPLACTVPYYLTKRLSESHTVHVVSRKRSSRREESFSNPDFVVHDVDTGDVPLVSGLLYVVVSTVYAAMLGLRYRYDVVYAFQHELVQGWVSSRLANAKFVVGLQSVPVRQDRDLTAGGHGDVDVRERVHMLLLSVYGSVVAGALRRATEVVCLTEGIRTVAETEYDVDLSDASIIGMGVDVETFTPDDQRRRSTRDDGGWTLIYVGSIHASRDLEHVIDALAMIERDVTLRVVGDGPDDYVASLQARARNRGVSEHIEWLGLVPHDEIPRLLWASDVAVSPLADIESYRISFPAKLLEYMAAECLVVATDVPPHRNLIDDERNGYLYDGGARDLQETLRRCFDQASAHPEMRREARATAEAHTWTDVVRRHETVICR